MPMPSLPLELVSSILTELRLVCGDDSEARRENGRNVTLVCKAWKPLGEGVVWHSLILNSAEKAREAVKHFERRTHLAPLVKELRVAEDEGHEAFESSSPISSTSEVEARPANDATIISLWTMCSTLRILKLLHVDWVDLGVLTSYLPLLANLRELHVKARRLNTLNPSSLLRQLPLLHHLECLKIAAIFQAANFGPPSPSPAPVPLPVRQFALTQIGGEEHNRHTYLSRLLDLVNPNSLAEITYFVEADAPPFVASIDRLLAFPSLRDLVVSCRTADSGTKVLERLLKLLPPREQMLNLAVTMPDESSTPASLPSLPTLHAFLTALPVFVTSLLLSQFVFTCTRAALPPLSRTAEFPPQRWVGRLTCLVRFIDDGEEDEPQPYSFDKCLEQRQGRPSRIVWFTAEEG